MEETPSAVRALPGHGPAAQLATSLRAALSSFQKHLSKSQPRALRSHSTRVDKNVEDAVGRKVRSKVACCRTACRATRPSPMSGMTIAPAAGVAQAINCQAAESGKVATHRRFRLTADEVNPVISECKHTRSQ